MNEEKSFIPSLTLEPNAAEAAVERLHPGDTKA
mgnify:CR=1 FL=1